MNSIAFAKHLFLLRRDHRMTIEDLASAMEVTPELVCEWECAKKSPTLDQINRLSKIYGMPLSDVIQSPKPVKPTPPPAPEPTPAPDPQPTVRENEEVKEESAEEYIPKRGKKKKKPAVWEILIIVLLLLIIGASLTFLIKPEWFPFLQYLGS